MLSERLDDILTPSKDLAIQLDGQHRLAVVRRLNEISRQGQASPMIFSRMRGAFPSDIVKYSGQAEWRYRPTDDTPVQGFNPELHPLNYEWYFTRSSASEIGREFAVRHGLTICMGVPMVASAAVRDHKEIVFIDKNPHSLIRFPELMRASEVHVMDAIDAWRISISAETLIFDSPWYVCDTVAWLLVASHLVRPGGTIAFALYPSLVRPSAILERDLVLEVASSIGSVHLVEDALAYQTPLFEHEALKAAGVLWAGDWRCGDLVVIKNSKPIRSPSLSGLSCRSTVDGSWQTFVIGSQVVKLRSRPSGSSGISGEALLNMVDGSFIFPAVSARNGIRESINLWTSRNRVASVRNTGAVSRILDDLAGGAAFESAIQPYEFQFGSNIRDQLNVFLGLES